MYYTYSLSGSSGSGKDSFLATATGDIDGDGKMDILSVDQHNNIKVVQDDLS